MKKFKSTTKKVICVSLSFILAVTLSFPVNSKTAFADSETNESNGNEIFNQDLFSDFLSSIAYADEEGDENVTSNNDAAYNNPNEQDALNDNNNGDADTDRQIKEKREHIQKLIDQKKVIVDDLYKKTQDLLNKKDPSYEKVLIDYTNAQIELDELKKSRAALDVLNNAKKNNLNLNNINDMNKLEDDPAAQLTYELTRSIAQTQLAATISSSILTTMNGFSNAIRVSYIDGKRVVTLDHDMLNNYLRNNVAPAFVSGLFNILGTLAGLLPGGAIIGPVVGGLGDLIYAIIAIIQAYNSTPPDRTDNPDEYIDIYNKIDQSTQTILNAINKFHDDVNKKFEELKKGIDNIAGYEKLSELMKISNETFYQGETYKSQKNNKQNTEFLTSSQLQFYNTPGTTTYIPVKERVKKDPNILNVIDVYDHIVSRINTRRAILIENKNLKEMDINKYDTDVPIRSVMTLKEYQIMYAIFALVNGYPSDLLPTGNDIGNIQSVYDQTLNLYYGDVNGNSHYQKLISCLKNVDPFTRDNELNVHKVFKGYKIDNAYDGFFLTRLLLLSKNNDYKVALQQAIDELRVFHDHNISYFNETQYVLGAYQLCKSFEGPREDDRYLVEDTFKRFNDSRNQLNELYYTTVAKLTANQDTPIASSVDPKVIKDSYDAIMPAADVFIYDINFSKSKKAEERQNILNQKESMSFRTLEEAYKYASQKLKEKKEVRINILKDIDVGDFNDNNNKTFVFPSIHDQESTGLDKYREAEKYITLTINLAGHKYTYEGCAFRIENPGGDNSAITQNIDDFRQFNIVSQPNYKGETVGKGEFIPSNKAFDKTSSCIISGLNRQRATAGPGLHTSGNLKNYENPQKLNEFHLQSFSLNLRDISIHDCKSCAISYNSALQDSFTATNCDFKNCGNHINGGCGVCEIGMYTRCLFKDCVFDNNGRTGNGGAIHFVNNPNFGTQFLRIEDGYPDLSVTRYKIGAELDKGLKTKQKVERATKSFKEKHIQFINTKFIHNGSSKGKGGAIAIDTPYYLASDYFEGSQDYVITTFKSIGDYIPAAFHPYYKLRYQDNSTLTPVKYYDMSYFFPLNKAIQDYFYYENCYFEGNHAQTDGGAVSFTEATNDCFPVCYFKMGFYGCTFNQNGANAWGGALFLDNTAEFNNHNFVKTPRDKAGYNATMRLVGTYISMGTTRYCSCTFNQDNAIGLGKAIFTDRVNTMWGSFENGKSNFNKIDNTFNNRYVIYVGDACYSYGYRNNHCYYCQGKKFNFPHGIKFNGKIVGE